MLPFRVRHFKGVSKTSRGKVIVVLTDLRGSPDPHFYPNLFVTSEYEVQGRSPHTIDKVLRSLGMAKAWAETREADLDDIFTEGEFLASGDVLDLVRYLALPATEQAREHQIATAQGKVVSITARSKGRRSDEDRDGDAVPSAELATRIRYVAKYAEWHRHRRFDNRTNPAAHDLHRNESAKASVANLRSKAPEVGGGWHDELSLEAPDPAVLMRIDEILTPGSPENPFKSSFVQWRNYLAYRMLFDTGARRDEVKTAKTDSVISRERKFYIRESKTVPRTVPIISKTSDVFDRFFKDHWLTLPAGCEAHKTGDIFTDVKGRPLTSGKFINRLFLAVREIDGPLAWKITPHTMRRAWNYILSQKIDRMPEGKRLPAEQEAAIRRRMMGWSENSRQPERYNRRHIRERADVIAQEMMDQLTTDPEGAGK